MSAMGCMSASQAARTQSVYNAGDEDTDSKPYGSHGSVTDTGSVDPQNLNKAQDKEFEGEKATKAANPKIYEEGFGA